MGAPVRITRYARYFDIPREQRRVIQTQPLGFINGVMREVAKRHDTPCAVATLRGKPVGWCSIAPAGAWRRSRKRRSIHTFVTIPFRRCGIGTRLVRAAREVGQCFNERVGIYETRRAVSFYRATGMKNILYKSGT